MLKPFLDLLVGGPLVVLPLIVGTVMTLAIALLRLAVGAVKLALSPPSQSPVVLLPGATPMTSKEVTKRPFTLALRPMGNLTGGNLARSVDGFDKVRLVESVHRDAMVSLQQAQSDIEAMASRLNYLLNWPHVHAADIQVAKPLLQAAMQRFQTRQRIVAELERRLEEAYADL